MKKRWVVQYKGHVIEIENLMFSGRLWIDDALARQRWFFGIRCELRAPIPQGDGAGEEIVCVVVGFPRVTCSVAVNGVPAAVVESKLKILDLLAFGLVVFGGAGLYRQWDAGFKPRNFAIILAAFVSAFFLERWRPTRSS